MSSEGKSSNRDIMVRIGPMQYAHVLDINTNETKLVEGPCNYIREEHEKIVLAPTEKVIVPEDHFCVVLNPIVRSKNGNIAKTSTGMIQHRYKDIEYRFHQELPFPLYPGEKLHVNVTPLPVVHNHTALHLQCIKPFKETVQDSGSSAEGASKASTISREIGDVWLFYGPARYVPRKEVEVVKTVKSVDVPPNCAVKTRALVDHDNATTKSTVKAGEEILHHVTGKFLPSVYEELVEVVHPKILIDTTALYVKAKADTEWNGKKYSAGEVWLVTNAECTSFIPEVNQEIVKDVKLTTLTDRQFCVIVTQITGSKQTSKEKTSARLIRGEAFFFLQPNESIPDGIRDVYVLKETEGLILSALQDVKEDGVERKAGTRWQIRGPVEFVPHVDCKVERRVTAIPLDSNEGIYVRNEKTGIVRAVIGQSYMLTEDEVLYEKRMPEEVERLYMSERNPCSDRGVAPPTGPIPKRDYTRVIAYPVPHNAAMQVYDYKEKKSRVVFGPDQVMLGPNDEFTVLSLSGGTPKRAHQIKSLALLLGPDFMTDLVHVETSDHAQLALKLAYNWRFRRAKDEDVEEFKGKLFSVPDFVGDICKTVGSRIRGAVAAVKFDEFHKNSARLIRTSVLGVNKEGRCNEEYVHPANGLIIYGIDIKEVQPVDTRTRESLQKSVQLAIEITTNSEEAAARQNAERVEQAARARLEQQVISDEAAAEEQKQILLERRAMNAAIESSGQAKAEAQSRADAANIEEQAAVTQAKHRAEAAKIEAEAELARVIAAREAELRYLRSQNELEVTHSREMAAIETDKFRQMVDSIGVETLRVMATADQDHRVKMLQALGLSSCLITDGTTPVNLMQTSAGLIGGMLPTKPKVTAPPE